MTFVEDTTWWPSATAAEVVGREKPAKLAFSTSIVIELEQADGEFIASEPQTGQYGEGDTEVEAIRNLLVSLAAIREELRSNEGQLSAELAADLRFLNEVLWR